MVIDKFEERFGGYSLQERIGAGGYGEVWKAEAPGGLAKAVKFVYGILGEERASRELKALQRIKEVRHPFLLSLERIEIIDGRLVIITELADSSLKERYQQCRNSGLSGIPRNQLLNYLSDTAEALDYMSEHFSLQHLDIKPENLLILGGRIKVADFGLVKEIENSMVSIMGGMTPVYAAPELFDGGPSRHSDQYSLAIVYQEMLSGTLPYPGKTTAQLANQHLRSQPQLSSLPHADRPIIARALSKDPHERFPNCRTLIDSLFAVKPSGLSGECPRPWKKLHNQEHTTTNVTQVCDTKSPPDYAAFDKGPCAIPEESSGKETPAASALPLAEISAKSFSLSLKEVFTEAERPSHSSSEIDPSASPDAWLDLDGRPACCDLHPLQITAATSLRPVLVIGAGGAAGGVIRKLHGAFASTGKTISPVSGCCSWMPIRKPFPAVRRMTPSTCPPARSCCYPCSAWKSITKSPPNCCTGSIAAGSIIFPDQDSLRDCAPGAFGLCRSRRGNPLATQCNTCTATRSRFAGHHRTTHRIDRRFRPAGNLFNHFARRRHRKRHDL